MLELENTLDVALPPPVIAKWTIEFIPKSAGQKKP